MKGMLFVAGAVFLQFDAFRVGTLVLRGDIVTLTAFGARQRYIYSHHCHLRLISNLRILQTKQKNSTGKNRYFFPVTFAKK
jgi:hypothetical protein